MNEPNIERCGYCRGEHFPRDPRLCMDTSHMARPIDRDLLDNLARPLPVMPGTYFWDTHGAHVQVYRKRGVDGLYVTPPGPNAVEVRVTARIAGNFVRVVLEVQHA